MNAPPRIDRGRRTIHLLPGNWYVGTDGELVVTVLGSCVAVCLRDPGAGVAGVNHFMLPGCGAVSYDPRKEDARFGIHSMELLIGDLQRNGASRSALEAKIFGGGSVLDSVASVRVGERNATFAVEYLRFEGIPIVARDLLGSRARKLRFDMSTGEARVKYVSTVERRSMMTAELSSHRENKLRPGTVELFT